MMVVSVVSNLHNACVCARSALRLCVRSSVARSAPGEPTGAPTQAPLRPRLSCPHPLGPDVGTFPRPILVVVPPSRIREVACICPNDRLLHTTLPLLSISLHPPLARSVPQPRTPARSPGIVLLMLPWVGSSLLQMFAHRNRAPARHNSLRLFHEVNVMMTSFN